MPHLIPQSLIDSRYSFLVPNLLGFALFVCFVYPIVCGIRLFGTRSPALFLYLFMCGSLCLLILWPALQGLRFCFGILPFVVFLGALGLQYLASKSLSSTTHKMIKALQVLGIVCLVFFALKSAAYIVRNVCSHHSPDSKHWEAYTSDAKDMYVYIQAHTEPNAIIVFFKPRVLYLQTGRLSIALREPETFIQRLESKGFEISGAPHHIAYILIFSEEYTLEHGLSQEYLQALQDFGAIRIAHQNAKFTLYALDSDKALAMPYPQGSTHD